MTNTNNKMASIWHCLHEFCFKLLEILQCKFSFPIQSYIKLNPHFLLLVTPCIVSVVTAQVSYLMKVIFCYETLF